jgi:hypothetical protein
MLDGISSESLGSESIDNCIVDLRRGEHQLSTGRPGVVVVKEEELNCAAKSWQRLGWYNHLAGYAKLCSSGVLVIARSVGELHAWMSSNIRRDEVRGVPADKISLLVDGFYKRIAGLVEFQKDVEEQERMQGDGGGECVGGAFEAAASLNFTQVGYLLKIAGYSNIIQSVMQTPGFEGSMELAASSAAVGSGGILPQLLLQTVERQAGAGADAEAKLAQAARTIHTQLPFVNPPGPPSNVRAEAVLGVAGEVLVCFDRPPDDSGAPVCKYVLCASPGNATCTLDVGAGNTAGGLMKRISGLSPGKSYTFTVRAVNSSGTGRASDPSNAISISATPAAPTIVDARPTGMNGEVDATFDPPKDDGGSRITSYVVRGRNGNGDGRESSASNNVVLTAPPGAPCNVSVTEGDGEVSDN